MRRVNRHLKPQPLPQKNGIDAISLVLPNSSTGENTLGATTVIDFLVARFHPHRYDLFESRFAAGEVVEASGAPVDPTAALTGQKIWYYRQLGVEKPVPFDIPVLFEDDWVLAIDKPHFLPTTPNGSFVAHTALVRLRVRESNPDLIPVHRLDRATAGVVLFAKTPKARAPFQKMFEARALTKTYEAVAPPISGLAPGEGLSVHSRIDKRHGSMQVIQSSVQFLPADAAGLVAETHRQRRARHRAGLGFEGLNAASRISCLSRFELGSGVLPAVSKANPHLVLPGTGDELAHYLLEPQTGKTHQLRAHLAAAGAPICGDVLYPKVLGHADDEPELPMQLLAKALEFEHPITGEHLRIESRRRLKLLPAL